MLGEFEYLLLAAVERLGEDAYGVTIRVHVENVTGRNCSLGALYTTLSRLENKGLVTTWMGEATAQRGGRSKRMVKITAGGLKAAAEFHGAVTKASRGVRWAAKAAGQKT